MLLCRLSDLSARQLNSGLWFSYQVQQWISAPVGIAGNKRADKLLKPGAQHPQAQTPPTKKSRLS